MDPVSIIVTALVAGLAAGAKESTHDALKSAYRVLRDTLAARVGRDHEARRTLDKLEKNPNAYKGALEHELRTAGISDQDKNLLEAAAHLHAELRSPRSGDFYQVDARYGRGMQFGPSGTQHNRTPDDPDEAG